MGKGDKRTRRGKIFAGSHGKTRPKPKKAAFVASEKPQVAPAEKPVKKRTAKRVPAAKAAAPEAPVETAPAEIETVTEVPEAPVEETQAEVTAIEPSENTDETKAETADAG